jgi:predicted peptidase
VHLHCTLLLHRADDTVVPVKNTDSAVEALRAVGNEVKYTRYETAPPCVTPAKDLPGHGSYELAFADPLLYGWLLEQSL